MGSWLAEQEVRGSIPGLAATISEIGYLLLPNRDMTERSLKRRKSSKTTTKQLVRLTVNRKETINNIVFSDSYWIPINGNLIVPCSAHPIYWVHWCRGITSHVAISGIGNQSSSHDGNRPNYHRHQRFLYCYTPRFISILTCGTYHWKIGTQLQVTLFPFMTTWLQNFQKPISSIFYFKFWY